MPVIFDFDGTLTVIGEEMERFYTFYLQMLSEETEVDGEEYRALVREAEELVAREPERHGWVSAGRVVCSPLVDASIRVRSVAELVLTRLGYESEDRHSLLDSLFGRFGHTVVSPFRDPMLEVFFRLLEGPREPYVVTNSETRAVQDKIRRHCHANGHREAAEKMAARVHGHARKGALTDECEDVPETLDVPGLPRPVYLRRGSYFSILSELRRRHGASWQDMAAVGDNFEVDLCLPFALGARVGLLHNERTPGYALEFVRRNGPRARLLDHPDDVYPLLDAS